MTHENIWPFQKQKMKKTTHYIYSQGSCFLQPCGPGCWRVVPLEKKLRYSQGQGLSLGSCNYSPRHIKGGAACRNTSHKQAAKPVRPPVASGEALDQKLLMGIFCERKYLSTKYIGNMCQDHKFQNSHFSSYEHINLVNKWELSSHPFFVYGFVLILLLEEISHQQKQQVSLRLHLSVPILTT